MAILDKEQFTEMRCDPDSMPDEHIIKGFCEGCKYKHSIVPVGGREYAFCSRNKGIGGLRGELKETDFCSRFKRKGKKINDG